MTIFMALFAGVCINASAMPVKTNPKADPIIIYTDGACFGNPGPAGLGVVLKSGPHRKELSEPLGMATNNIAELTAILRALESVKDKTRRVLIHSDSAYAIGVLTKNWKPKKNQDLIHRIRKLTKEFSDLEFVKVAGHAGVEENERCDELAKAAAQEAARRAGG